MLLLPFSACKKDDSGLKTIRLNEVTHSVFYAPLYVAIEGGYFEEEGLKIVLTDGKGANNCMTAILSNSDDIALMGPESCLYVNDQGKKDAPIVFGQLTQKDGSFLVSRVDEPNFTWEGLEGKEILAGRVGGVPFMTFEYILNEHGLFDGENVTLNIDVQYALMTAAFEEGTADYCTMFEPTATEFEKAGKGFVVASVGEASGEVPYTSFVAKPSYINKNKDTVKAFLKGIKKAYDYMSTATDEEIARLIVGQFPNITIESLTTSITSYRNIDAWTDNLQATEASFNKLQDIMQASGELDERIAFEDIFDNSYAKEIFG